MELKKQRELIIMEVTSIDFIVILMVLVVHGHIKKKRPFKTENITPN